MFLENLRIEVSGVGSRGEFRSAVSPGISIALWVTRFIHVERPVKTATGQRQTKVSKFSKRENDQQGGVIDHVGNSCGSVKPSGFSKVQCNLLYSEGFYKCRLASNNSITMEFLTLHRSEVILISLLPHTSNNSMMLCKAMFNKFVWC